MRRVQVAMARLASRGPATMRRLATRRVLLAAVLIFTSGAAVPGVAQPVRRSATAAIASDLKTTRYTFAFSDADVALVAEEVLGRTLAVPYSVDQGVTGKISFRVDRQLTAVQLLEAFEASLEASDIVMVRDGDSFILRSRAKARSMAGLSSASARSPAAGSTGHAVGYDTASVSLAYAKPSEVAKTLQAMSSTDPVVLADDKSGTLILGGSGETLQALVQLAKTFDRSGLESSKIRFFELATAPSETVATELDKVLTAASFSGATVVPLKRLNGLLVFARTSQTLDEIATWVVRLDVPSKDKSATLFVYRPKNAAAESLGSTLSSVISGGGSGGFDNAFSNRTTAASAATTRTAPTLPFYQQPQVVPPPTPFAESLNRNSALDGDPARLGVDKDSNTLLIFTTPSRWIQIQRVLDEIDRPPRQVMIEAEILEVTLNDRDSLGVDWSVIGSGGRLVVSSIYSAAGKIAANTPGLSVTYLGGEVAAAINALGTQGAVEVVSAPKVLALDNHTARLDVGDQVPIVTQAGQSTISGGAPVINSVDYRDTGVILKVTPRVSGDSRIALEIDQEVSAVSQTTSSAINSPTIQQRKISTSLIVDSGGTIALGGLISSGRQYTDSGFPGLKDIPIVGHLFKTSLVTHNRTELIVLLTARVVGGATPAERITGDLVAEMHELERRGLLR